MGSPNCRKRLYYNNFSDKSTPHNTSSCLTKNTMRRRKLPPTPLKREMETSRKPDKKPRRVNSMNNSVNISTNGENREPRRKRKPRGKKSEPNKKKNWLNKRRKRKND